MANRRVVVVVPGAEGNWIVRAFERERVFAKVANSTAPPSEGGDDVLIVDREVPSVDAWCSAFGGNVILVGWERPDEEELAAMDLVAFYNRPVDLSGLIRRVQTLVGGAVLARPPTPMALAETAPEGRAAEGRAAEDRAADGRGDSTPDEEVDALSENDSEKSEPPVASLARPTLAAPPNLKASAASVMLTPPREPTVRLQLDDDSSARDEIPTPPRPPLSQTSKSPAEQNGVASGSPLSRADETSSRATLSPHIARLLTDADRRLFPNQAPLAITFPAGDASPEMLVPDDLLAESTTPLEPREADPLEAFTFVGTPDLLDTASGQLESAAREESVELTPHTVVERASAPPGPRSDRPSERAMRASDRPMLSAPGRPQEGTAPQGAALRLALEAAARKEPVRLILSTAGGPRIELDLDGETVRAVRGPVMAGAHRALAAEGRVAPGPAELDEDAAAELLGRAVMDGSISVFEREQRTRLVAESLVGEALLAAEVRYSLTSRASSTTDRAKLLRPSAVAGTLSRVASEQARRRLDAPTALRWMGVDPSSRLRVKSVMSRAAVRCGFEPEIVAMLASHDGRTVSDFIHGLPASTGAPGVLFVLGALGAIGLDAPRAPSRSPTPAHRELQSAIERAHGLALEGTYFAVLGVAPHSHPRAIEEAYRERLAELNGDLYELGLDRLEPARSLARDAIAEAWAVLQNPRWRELYTRGTVPTADHPSP